MENERGSITVFFSLVCVLIFSLLGTMLEGARMRACEVHSYRTLKMAAESLFTEYNRPLYEEYCLFFIEEAGIPFSEAVSGYAKDMISPTESEGTMNLLEGSMTDVQVENIIYAGDNRAYALKKEVRDYMSRTLPADALKSFLNKTEKIEESTERAEEIEKEVEEKQEAAKMDLSMLELMKLIDGAHIEDGHLQSGETHFVKMFYQGEKRAEKLAISNQEVWNVVKENLVDIGEVFVNLSKRKNGFKEDVKQCIKVTEDAIDEAQRTKRDFQSLSKESADMKDYYNRMDSFLNGTKESGGILAMLKGNKKVLEDTMDILNGDITESTEKELKNLWKSYDTKGVAFDYTGLSARGEEKNPIHHLSSLLTDGFLELVCEKPKELSEKTTANPDYFAEHYEEVEQVSQDYGEQAKAFAAEEKVSLTNVLGDMTGYAMDEFCLDRYIGKFCGSMCEEKGDMEKQLDYEMEYVLGGKGSDKENLAAVASRLLLVRTITNFGTLLSSKQRRTTAYTAALSIVGFTGMEPLVRLTQTLLLLVWSMAEGMVDVAALLCGNEVPLIKKSKEMQMSFKDLFHFNRKLIQEKAKKIKKSGVSLKYSDYITIFLILTKQEIKCYRMMDLIQWNLSKNYNSRFQLLNVVYSAEFKADFLFETRFFRLPSVQDMLDRSLYQFAVNATYKCSYS